MNRKGFTLIELLIVIAILGILVALILPRFSDVRSDANKKVCIANMRGLVSAMNTYSVKENKNGDEIAWGTGPWLASNLVTWNYLAAEPKCPVPGSAIYDLTGNADTPDVDCPNDGTTGYTDHVWP